MSPQHHQHHPKVPNALDRLRRNHPYPNQCPHIRPDFGESWFGRGNALLLKKFLSPDMPDDARQKPQLILELGVWKGRSTDFMLRVNATCTVICVDTWNGDTSIGYTKDPDVVYNQCMRNLWEHRRRVIPVRMDGREAIPYLHARGIYPDLIYLDMGHSYDEVKGDLVPLMKYYKDVPLLGDDILHWEGVARAVKECVRREDIHRLEINHNCYALVPRKYDDRYELYELDIRPVDASDDTRVCQTPYGRRSVLAMSVLAVVIAVDTGVPDYAKRLATCVSRIRDIYASPTSLLHVDIYVMSEANPDTSRKTTTTTTARGSRKKKNKNPRNRAKNANSMRHPHASASSSSSPSASFNRGWLNNVGFLLAQQQQQQQQTSGGGGGGGNGNGTKRKADAVLFQDVTLLPDDTLGAYYHTYPRHPMQLCYNHRGYVYEKWFFGSLLTSPTDFHRLNGYPNDICGWNGWDNELLLRFRSAAVRMTVPKTGSTAQSAPPIMTTAEWNRTKQKPHINKHSDTWRHNGVSNARWNVVSENSSSSSSSSSSSATASSSSPGTSFAIHTIEISAIR
jgi:hypothetical protein